MVLRLKLLSVAVSQIHSKFVAANGIIPDLHQDGFRQNLSTKDYPRPASSPCEDAEMLLLSLIHFCSTEILSMGWRESNIPSSEV